MPLPQKILVITLSLALFIFIVSRVYSGKLREEYSWLWLAAGVVALILAVWTHALVVIQKALGFVAPANVVVFFSLLFLVFINLHASMKISRLTNIQKNLVQEAALLREELDRLRPSANESKDEE